MCYLPRVEKTISVHLSHTGLSHLYFTSFVVFLSPGEVAQSHTVRGRKTTLVAYIFIIIVIKSMCCLSTLELSQLRVGRPTKSMYSCFVGASFLCAE